MNLINPPQRTRWPILALAILAVGIATAVLLRGQVQRLLMPIRPLPLAASPSPPAQPRITWSVPDLAETMFPGTQKTVNISFQSDQNLGDTTVWVTPSLDGTLSTSPTAFPSIAAGQTYQLSVTLSAPQAFQRRSYGGTIHLRSANGPPRTYAPPLPVNLQVDFKVYLNDSLGFSFNYPSTWTSVVSLDHTYFTAPPDVEVLDIFLLPLGQSSLLQVAQMDISDNNCPALDTNGHPVDHIISSPGSGVLYRLSCSSTSDDFNYVFVSHRQMIKIVYHDDFAFDASEDQQVLILQQIIHSVVTRE
jgi:hypothetical protein